MSEMFRLSPDNANVDAVRAIREARKKRGISAKRLAEMVGKLRETIIRLESGRHDVRINTLAKLADALGLEILIVEKGALGEEKE